MGKYDDIINLLHHQSKTRPHMSCMERAAQFSPFAALTGHSDAIRETERKSQSRTDLEAIPEPDDGMSANESSYLDDGRAADEEHELSL